MARDGRGRLGLGDRLILLVAWVTTCGLVYLLGFYVGKGTQAHSLRLEQQVVRLPVTSAPPPEGQRPKTAPEFGFYDKLMGEQGGERLPDKVHEEAKPAPAPAASSASPRSASAAPASLAPPPAALAAGGFTVRTNPTRDREEADGLMKQLRSRGYDATLVRVVRDGDAMYRVQVGRFNTAEQASETMHRLREHEGVEHAFVASE